MLIGSRRYFILEVSVVIRQAVALRNREPRGSGLALIHSIHFHQKYRSALTALKPEQVRLNLGFS